MMDRGLMLDLIIQTLYQTRIVKRVMRRMSGVAVAVEWSGRRKEIVHCHPYWPRSPETSRYWASMLDSASAS
jgi:hypothetical protein